MEGETPSPTKLSHPNGLNETKRTVVLRWESKKIKKTKKPKSSPNGGVRPERQKKLQTNEKKIIKQIIEDDPGKSKAAYDSREI